MKRRLLITGATGFIGKNLAEAFREEYELILPERFELDLGNREAALQYVKRHEADFVIHCANSSDTNHTAAPKDTYMAQNLRMFFTLDSLKDYYGKLIYFGSGAEFGQLHYVPQMREESFGQNVPEADDVYGLAKFVMAKCAEKSPHVLNLRLFGIFGKYELWSRRFISNCILRALFGMPILINQNKVFDYMWVADLKPVLEWFFEHEPKYGQYNVCTGVRYDLLSIARMVCEAAGVPETIQVKAEGGREYSGDNSRLLAELGTAPFTDLKTAIGELTAYYRSILPEIDRSRL